VRVVTSAAMVAMMVAITIAMKATSSDTQAAWRIPSLFIALTYQSKLNSVQTVTERF